MDPDWTLGVRGGGSGRGNTQAEVLEWNPFFWRQSRWEMAGGRDEALILRAIRRVRVCNRQCRQDNLKMQEDRDPRESDV